MSEIEQVLEAYEGARRRGTECVLATVVRVSGSTYRRPGARMLLTRDGHTVGAISGGCLEREVRQRAFWLTQNQAAVLVRYDTTSPDDAVHEFGLGCQGVVEVLLERLPQDCEADHLAHLRSCRARGHAAVIATIIETTGVAGAAVGDRRGLATDEIVLRAFPNSTANDEWPADVSAAAVEARACGRSRTLRFEDVSGAAVVFIEVCQPPLPLVIFGAGYDVAPVVQLARGLGWRVTVVDARAAATVTRGFEFAGETLVGQLVEIAPRLTLTPHTAAVIMSHNYAEDLGALRLLLRSPVRYIGQLGPRSRTDALLRDLADEGVDLTPNQTARLHAPVGLDLGAENAQEIALAIVAEIQAVFAERDGGMLRDSTDPIHESARGEAAGTTTPFEVRACPLASA